MTFKIVLLLIHFFGFSFCDEKNIPVASKSCLTSELNANLTYEDLVFEIPKKVISTLTERPNQLGALGRNKDGYFHVRFQFDMTRLVDYSIKFQSEEGLTEYVKNLNYSFSHQNHKGDFQFIAPDYILKGANYRFPSKANLASGTAFFAYSLELSLNNLRQSEWYRNSIALTNLRNDIEALKPNLENMLGYLKSSVDSLYRADAYAPNRLLFNAIAFYSLGIYLDDQEAKSIGIDFANKALSQSDETEGYFIEGGGWDSSYNGVAIKLGFELFTLIPTNSEQSTKNKLEKVITCATDWQKSRVLSTGEISTEGNTRVFLGGEKFLGNEKGVDALKTVKAFFYMSALSNEKEYDVLAQRIIEYYE